MRPDQLRAESFASYPPEARALADQHLETLQRLPLTFLPLLLREAIEYDWRFSAERREIVAQLEYLESIETDRFAATTRPFSALRLTPELERFDWVNKPTEFSERLSAHLWATHQMDAFRAASVEYIRKVNEARKPETPARPRLVMAALGEGARGGGPHLFRKLRPHGSLFTAIEARDGVETMLDHLAMRAGKDGDLHAHWYIDGAVNQPISSKVSCVSYSGLAPARQRLLERMVQTMSPGGGGPELLRTQLASTQPTEVGLASNGSDALINRFKLSLLTQGSGTQIFSTTFVQWSAREVLRRAQPLTLVARWTPRQRDAEVARLDPKDKAVLDPEASLVDAEIGAYYTWLNLRRLPGAEEATFIAWFEGQRLAIAIGPQFARGKEENRPATVRELLALSA